MTPEGALHIIQNINPAILEINLSRNILQTKERARQVKMEMYKKSAIGREMTH